MIIKLVFENRDSIELNPEQKEVLNLEQRPKEYSYNEYSYLLKEIFITEDSTKVVKIRTSDMIFADIERYYNDDELKKFVNMMIDMAKKNISEIKQNLQEDYSEFVISNDRGILLAYLSENS
jgi:hypothetical protein